MSPVALMLACLLIGILLRWSGRMPENTPKVLGGWVINVALPAAAFHSVHGLTMSSDYWLAALTPWIGVAIAAIVMVPLCWARGWSRHRLGALLLIGGWGNTSFVGLPMIAVFAGKQWLGLGIVIDLVGSYLALSTIGLCIATTASCGRFDWRASIRQIATFPPFLAMVVALAITHVPVPDWLMQVFGSLGETMTPIALAAVGFALKMDRLPGRIGALVAGLGHRLFIAPLAIVVMYMLLGKAGDPASNVAMLEMAMPPMLGASIIALDHNLEPDLVALLIGIGVPLSLLTAWGWWAIIGVL